MDSWSAHASVGAWLWEGPLHPNPGLHGKPSAARPQSSLSPGLRHIVFRQRQLADGVPPCALALGKFEVADPRGISRQRKRGWWCVLGKGVGTERGWARRPTEAEGLGWVLLLRSRVGPGLRANTRVGVWGGATPVSAVNHSICAPVI